MATYILRQEETGLGLVFVAGFVLIAAATILLQMALTIVFVQHQWGSPVSMPEAFEQSRARFWPTLVMLVLGALGMLCGLILFVVPGLFLYVAWYVALPVVVGERRDATDALDRSLHLTRGYRWPVAGVALLGLVIVFGVGGLLGGIGGTLSGPDAVGMDADAPVGRVILFSVFQSLGSTIGGVIGLALVASAYVELLAVRGEYDPDE